MRGLKASLSSLLLGLGATTSATALAADERLVVVGGRATEIVFALGAGDAVVGVDTTSTWPPEVRALPRVGYVRHLPVEGILALRPDRLLAVPEAGPERSLTRLDAAMRVDILPPAGPREVPQLVRWIAERLDRTEHGETVASQLEARLSSLPTQHPAPPSVLVLLATGGDTLLAGGAGSVADALLDAVGLRNAVGDVAGFKPLSREALLTLDADLVVIAETAPGAYREEAWPVLRRTPAGQRGRILVRDSMYLLGFGLRVAEALEEILAASTDPDFVAWTRE